MPITRQPSFAAKKGTFKDRVENIGGDVDFFGAKWAKEMDKMLAAVATVKADARQVYVVLVGKFYARVQVRTPVRTGQAKRGWRFEVIEDTADNYAVTVWNGVPYIVYLEFGWSSQAPKGMIRITLAEMTKELRLATKTLLTKKAV